MTQAAVRTDDLLDEITRRGTERYETELRETLEREHCGEFVAIHPESGQFSVAADEEDALRRLRDKQPEGLLYLRRIGPPTAGDLRLAERLAGSVPGK